MTPSPIPTSPDTNWPSSLSKLPNSIIRIKDNTKKGIEYFISSSPSYAL